MDFLFRKCIYLQENKEFYIKVLHIQGQNSFTECLTEFNFQLTKDMLMHLHADEITAKDIVTIVKQWQQSVVWLDKMVYEDAKKEFSLSSMTGFGADGNKEEQVLDFEQVRGDFESNPFVTTVLKHIQVKTELGNELITRLGNLL